MHYYLSEQNQVLETRLNADSTANRQFTWGPRYVDDLVLRTRDFGKEGVESLYALQDAGWNIVALADASGTIQERFKYDPYGRSTVLDPSFANDSDGVSDFDWEYRFTSREFDAETKLSYFRARYWHEGLGRFLGRDPLEYIDGGSLYAGYFVPGGTDPSGRRLLSGQELDEANRRRGRGPWKDSAQHCWAACFVGAAYGLGNIAALVGDLAEFAAFSSDGWRDIKAQHYGGGAGNNYPSAIVWRYWTGQYVPSPSEYCDEKCKTCPKS